MPKSTMPPAYKTHSYAYWSNMFASPVDVVTSVARANSPQTGATPTGNGIVNFISKNDSIRSQVDILNRMQNGDPSAVDALKGLKRSDLDPKVQQLYDQVTKVGPVGPTQDESFITRVFDVMSRFQYATSNAFLETIKQEQMANKSSDIQDTNYLPIVGPSWWSAFSHGQALWDGLAGYQKTSWADVLQQAHPDMPDVAKGVLGFALDIAMDPTSYIGVGVGKTVTKGVVKGSAAIVNDSAKAAETIAKAFQGEEGAAKAAKVQAFLEQQYAKQGLNIPISKLDLSNPDHLKTFLTGALQSDPKAQAKLGLAARQQHRQAVTLFLDSVKGVLTEDFKVQRASELLQKAMDEGSVVNPVALQPSSVIQSLTYKAMTLPEAEVIARITVLRSTHARINSILAKHPAGPDAKLLKAKSDEISKELDSLVTQTPLDMTDPNVIKAVNELADTNPEFVALTQQAKVLRTKLQYIKINGVTRKLDHPMTHETLDRHIAGDVVHHQATVGTFKYDPAAAADLGGAARNVGKGVRSGLQPGRIPGDTAKTVEAIGPYKQYKKMLTELDAIEAQRATIMADHVLKTMDEIHLPESVRLAKYRKTKDWRKVADTYVKVYERERIGAKAADQTAAALTDAGNLGGAVKAVKAKESLGKLSKNVNKSLENARRELQYRIHNGELTVAELDKYLKEAGVQDPSLIHDFTQLTPQTSRILNLGESLPPTIEKALNVTGPDLSTAITLNNKQITMIMQQATVEAQSMVDKLTATALDIMVRSTSLESRKTLDLRLGFMGSGPVVASMAAPELLRSALKKIYTLPVAKQGIDIFNKALVSSAGLDSSIARIRAREAGRTTELIARNGERIRRTFQSVPPSERMHAWNQMLRTDIKTYANPDLVKALHDELALIAAKFQHDAFPGLRDPLSVSEVNQWIPGKHKLTKSKQTGWELDAGSLTEGEDPVQWLVNALRGSNIKTMDPVQVIWDLQIATEKALARKATVETIVQQFGIATGVHGDALDPLAQRLVDKYGYDMHKLGSSEYIFDPETLRNLDKIQELFSSPKHMEVFGEYAGKITQAWKRAVTIYNPGFHARNTFGDIFVSWLDGVQGVHGIQSHRMALRTIKRFRNLTDPNDPMIRAMGQPEMLNAYDAAKKAPMPESHNTVLFRKNGRDITIGDIYAMYVNEGLLSGYTNTEFNAVFKTPKSFGASPVGRLASGVNQNVMHLSEAREDVFRLAHFIDVVRKSPAKQLEVAAAEAGARVRKFHFDYSDFTMTEKMLFARVFPFYKWTRKAFPLMVESLFATPGKMLMYPKAMNNVGVAMGYGGDTPDIVTPEWISSRMLAPILSHDGATTYAGMALPYDALRAVGAPGDSILNMLHPGLKALIENAQGAKLGTGAPTDPMSQLVGLLPQSNFAGKQLTGTGTPEQIASFLTGLTVTQNNSKTINAELQKKKAAQADERQQLKQSAADLASKLRGY